MAQRFSVGLGQSVWSSPEGTAEGNAWPYQPSLRDLLSFVHRLPNAEALGYFQTSLRDVSEAGQLHLRGNAA